MRVHYLQHVPFEGLGSIESWLVDNGCQITATRFFDADPLPDHANIDLVIVMGGPMGVQDEAEFPWLSEEKQWLRRIIDDGKRVLGICLGAQLVAEVLGAQVTKNQHTEIGWFPVYRPEGASESTVGSWLPNPLDVFHWHGDTFSIPDGALHLATSVGCKNQGFVFEERVVALQFHLEVTTDSVQSLVANGRDELISSKYISSEEQILSVGTEKYRAVNRVMEEILSRLTV